MLGNLAWEKKYLEAINVFGNVKMQGFREREMKMTGHPNLLDI